MSGPPAPPTHRYTPSTYRPLRTEQGVFTTPPYSGEIKRYWRFKDAPTATGSAQKIWSIFEEYRDKGDFVGADMARKFLQMGRTRSLRYALRRGGKKYAAPSPSPLSGSATTKDRQGKARGAEIPRTGEVYDEGKLEGARVFEGYWRRCWDDAVYVGMWEGWKGAAAGSTGGGGGTGAATGVGNGTGEGKGSRMSRQEGGGDAAEEHEGIMDRPSGEEDKQVLDAGSASEATEELESSSERNRGHAGETTKRRGKRKTASHTIARATSPVAGPTSKGRPRKQRRNASP